MEFSYRLNRIVSGISFSIRAGELWAIVGGNGSGKSTLASLLAGQLSPSRGSRTAYAGGISHISFEGTEPWLAAAKRADPDEAPTPRTLLSAKGQRRMEEQAGSLARLVRDLGMASLMDRDVRLLSTGELRKALMLVAIADDPRLLVLDGPYDGLDRASGRELDSFIAQTAVAPRAVVVATGRMSEIPAGTTHIIELNEGRARFTGRIEEWGPRDKDTRGPDPRGSASRSLSLRWQPDHGALEEGSKDLIVMESVSVAYGSQPVLHAVNWTVTSGERWVLHGPNGAGKSTLLSLITGDNPKAYGQRVFIFGRLRGSGESVQEIKQRIGFVSGDLQLRYPHRTTVREVVLSGFKDSVGLYARTSGYEEERADAWIAEAGLSRLADRRLRDLSFGVQRMALLGRAIIKQPQLLIADEPCQGLDDLHRGQVLNLLDDLAESLPALLYVTHDPSARLACLTHELELFPAASGSVALVRRLPSSPASPS